MQTFHTQSPNPMAVLSEDTIKACIVPHLSKGKRGKKPQVGITQIVSAILYRLKTGCQWRELPVGEFFGKRCISWQGVYHHFRKWTQDGSFRKVWVSLLREQRRLLDLSSVQLDGSQTICMNGGECISYQRRKAANSCNSLFLSDDQGVLLAMGPPMAGAHHDLYQVGQVMGELCGLLKEAGITVEGLFLNADAGFDSEGFRAACSALKIEANIDANPRNGQSEDGYVYFDGELFKRRKVIEHAFAWIDSFKALLIRFETKVNTWMALHFLAFAVLFIRKTNRKT